MANTPLTTQQQQSVNDSGGYFSVDPTTGESTWVDMSGSPGAGQGGTASTGATTIQQLLNAMGPQAGQTPADLASILGSLSSGIKANRVTQGDFTQKYDQLALADQTGRNQTESDALKKLNDTSYLLNGGSHFTPPTLSLNGKTYNTPNLGYGPEAATPAQQAGASALQSQLVSRLSPGGTVTPSPLSSYATPGTGENLASGGAAALGAVGAITNALSGVSKATAAAGAGSKLVSLLKGLVGGGGGGGSDTIDSGLNGGLSTVGGTIPSYELGGANPDTGEAITPSSQLGGLGLPGLGDSNNQGPGMAGFNDNTSSAGTTASANPNTDFISWLLSQNTNNSGGSNVNADAGGNVNLLGMDWGG